MKSNEHKPTHGGYPDFKKWSAESIWHARVLHPLRGYDAAIAQFAAFAKLRPQHKRVGDAGCGCGSE